MSTKRAPAQKLCFTQEKLDGLELPEKGKRAVYHDTKVSGLQVRVTANGVKTFYVFQRVNGKPERVRVGRHPYPIMSIDQARKEAKAIIHQIAEGESPAAARRKDDAALQTLAEAVVEYLQKKRRRDGLPLKQRTHDDYMAMLKPGRLTAAGKRTRGGTLAKLAGKPIHGITAGDIKALHEENLQRGERQAIFALQTLRAVLRWHTVEIDNDPFSPATKGKHRIVIPKTRPSDKEPVGNLLRGLGGFWRTLQNMPESPARDYIKFLLLTGCRAGEPRTITMDNVNLQAGRIVLRDTKNRSDHVLRLSKQALAIVERAAEGKAGTDKLFPVSVVEVNKAAHELVAATGLAFVPKMTRSMFASIAAELVTASTLKSLMNHTDESDIAGTFYITKEEDQLRAGWQMVANHIEALADAKVVPIRGGATCSSN